MIYSPRLNYSDLWCWYQTNGDGRDLPPELRNSCDCGRSLGRNFARATCRSSESPEKQKAHERILCISSHLWEMQMARLSTSYRQLCHCPQSVPHEALRRKAIAILTDHVWMLCEAALSVSNARETSFTADARGESLVRYVSFISTEQLPLFELLAARQPGVHTALKAVSRIQDHFLCSYNLWCYNLHTCVPCAFSTPAVASMRNRRSCCR